MLFLLLVLNKTQTIRKKLLTLERGLTDLEFLNKLKITGKH